MFWLTKDTVWALFGETYKSWELFGPIHLFWLGLSALLTFVVWKYFPKLEKEKRRKLYVILMWLMIADEMFKDIPAIITGQFIPEFLPFHLCSVNIFVCILNTYKENKYTKAILTCACIPAALCALIMPNWQALPIWNFMHLHSTTIHIMLLLYPMMILAEGYNPEKKLLPYVGVYVVGLALMNKVINYFLGTNFMFLTHNENNPALILLEKIFGKFYDLGIILGVVLLVFIMMNIWNAIQRKRI